MIMGFIIRQKDVFGKKIFVGTFQKSVIGQKIQFDVLGVRTSEPVISYDNEVCGNGTMKTCVK